MKTKLILVILLLLTLPGCALFEGNTASPTPVSAAQTQPQVLPPTGVIAEGAIVPRDFAHLGFATGGTVAEVLIEEGKSVQAGEILGKLSETEQIQASLQATIAEKLQVEQALKTLRESAELAQAQAEQALVAARQNLVAAERRLADLDTSAYQEELDNARIKVNDLKDALKSAQEEYDKVADLASTNPVRKDAEAALDAAQADVDEAERQYQELLLALESAKAGVNLSKAAVAEAERTSDKLQSGPDPDQVALLEARLAAAEAQLAALEAQLNLLVVKAPIDGTLVKVNVTPGERVSPGQVAFVLADFSQWYVETDDLTEIEVVEIAAGDQVSVEADAFPGTFIPGVVEKVSDVPEIKRGDVTYTVRIRLDSTDLPIRWGMTAVVTFK